MLDSRECRSEVRLVWRSVSERTSESRREEKEGVRSADRVCVRDYSHTELGGGGYEGSLIIDFFFFSQQYFQMLFVDS